MKDENAYNPPEGSLEPAEADEQIASEHNVEDLLAELEKSQTECKDFFEGWQRERADFLNYKKRVERDQIQLTQALTGSIARKYLPIIDDLDRALNNRPSGEDASRWAEGIELIYRKLQAILESEGIERIPAEEESFDPNRHEAISHEDSPDHASNEIIEVVQQGYQIGDRILRPALVRVAR